VSTPAQRLSALGLNAKKALGQHFLHDRGIVERICAVASLKPDATVVEIGPGLGILTEALAERVATVVALEKDEQLAAALRTIVPPNVDVRAVDALACDAAELAPAPYDLVANLPYNVATAILRRFLDSAHPPRSCTFMVQREVAERMVTRPPDMNILAVAMQFHGSPRIALHIGRGAFTPPPRVSSAVVHMTVERKFDVPQAELAAFFELVRAGFSARRKTLRNSLLVGGLSVDAVDSMLLQARIDGSRRPQMLDVADWYALFVAGQRIAR